MFSPGLLELPKATKPVAVDCPPVGPCVAEYTLSDAVDDDSTEAAIDWLKTAEKAGAKTALFTLNTNGGSVEAGLELIKAMEASPLKITCLVDHKGYSMGLAILEGRGCHRRLMTKRASLMGHSVAGGGMLSGGAQMFHNIGARIETLNSVLAEIIGGRLNIGVPGYKAKTAGGAEYWLDWTEAVHVGAVYATVENPSTVLREMQLGRTP
jgi:ATP-dependent protease ClpP protease subunit